MPNLLSSNDAYLTVSTGNWSTHFGGTLSRVTSPAPHAGTATLKFSGGGNLFGETPLLFGAWFNGTDAVSSGTSIFPFRPDLTASAWILLDSSFPAPPAGQVWVGHLSIDIFDNTGRWIGSTASPTVPVNTSSWTEVTATTAFIVGAAFVGLTVQVYDSVDLNRPADPWYISDSFLGYSAPLPSAPKGTLIIPTWDLDTISGPSPPHTGDFTSYYPAAARPFLAEFPRSPEETPSLQYRDAATGTLLAVHPYSETPDYLPGGWYGYDSDITYGPGPSAVRDDYLYLCGWNDSAIWKLRTQTAEQVWRLDGYQHGMPAPAVGASMVGPCLSPDGSLLYLRNDPTDTYIAIRTSDGSLDSTIPVVGSIFPDMGSTMAPDGTIYFGWNGGPTANRGIYKLDLTTGVVSLVLTIASTGFFNWLTSGTGADYLYCYQLAAHPAGDGFAFAVQNYNASGYHSGIVEAAWDGTPTRLYDYVASGLDGQRLAMMLTVAYSSDGNWLYGVPDTSWAIIWRFARGPGSVGGDAPWMQTDYLTRDDWALDGSMPGGGGAHALWSSTIAGAAFAPSGVIPPLRLLQRDDTHLRGATSAQASTRLRGPNCYL